MCSSRLWSSWEIEALDFEWNRATKGRKLPWYSRIEVSTSHHKVTPDGANSLIIVGLESKEGQDSNIEVWSLKSHKHALATLFSKEFMLYG